MGDIIKFPNQDHKKEPSILEAMKDWEKREGYDLWKVMNKDPEEIKKMQRILAKKTMQLRTKYLAVELQDEKNRSNIMKARILVNMFDEDGTLYPFKNILVEGHLMEDQSFFGLTINGNKYHPFLKFNNIFDKDEYEIISD